jgi:hypothetical protein
MINALRIPNSSPTTAIEEVWSALYKANVLHFFLKQQSSFYVEKQE